MTQDRDPSSAPHVAAPRVTLRDVADRAGVSRAAASFVLTGRRDMRISAEAQERVRQAARELDYRPNLLARSLRTNLSQTIGFVSDVVATEPFAGGMIRGSLATALQRRHLMLIGETQGDAAVESRLVRDMLDRGVGGFVYAAMFTRRARPSAALRGHPVVLLNCVGHRPGHPTVIPDEEGAGAAAASVLLAAGHRTGIYVVGSVLPETLAAQERMAGIRRTLEAAGAAPAGHLDCMWWPEPARAAVTGLLHDGGRPRALVCLNDRIALGAYQALAAAGLGVPDDVSVVAFDDSDLASWLRPGLTSVAIPHVELGRVAVEVLLDGGRTDAVHRVAMPVRERDSVAPPAAG